MYNIRFKKTRITEFIPHYFTLHDDANIKARLKQKDKPCTQHIPNRTNKTDTETHINNHMIITLLQDI